MLDKFPPIPEDALKILGNMQEDWGYPISQMAADSDVSIRRTGKLMQAFHTLGWAKYGPWMNEDSAHVNGSGYSRSALGTQVLEMCRGVPR